MSKTDDLIALYTSPNVTNNVSIEYAERFAAWMGDLGMPYVNGVFAYPTGANSAVEPISTTELLALGVPAQTVLNLYGQVPQGTQAENDDEPVAPKGYNIGLETLLIKGLDPVTQYNKLFAEHHPGTTGEDAALALEELPIMQVGEEEVLTSLKVVHGIKA